MLWLHFPRTEEYFADPAAHGRLTRPDWYQPGSPAIDGYLQCSADLFHPDVSKAPNSFDEDGDRDTFDRIQIHRRTSWNGILTRVEHHLAGQSTDRRSAGSHEGAAQSRDCGVS